MEKHDLSERDICTKLITPAILQAGWMQEQFREEVKRTPGRVIVRGKVAQRAKDPTAKGGPSGGLAEEVLGQLTDILPHLRPEILAFAQRLVDTRFDELRRREFNAYEVGLYLVEIAMTLQRFDDTRSAGLDLFETLLGAGLDEANKALKDVDEVDEVLPESPRMLRRRRRQGRNKGNNSKV